jgi:hypothetical protein
MAKNKDGFEAGQPVSQEDFVKFRAKRRHNRENGKAENVRSTTKRGGKSVSESAGEETKKDCQAVTGFDDG